jgi:hypothetical protein
MTFTQEDQRDKIRSQLQYEITHPDKPGQETQNKPSSGLCNPDKKKSVRSRFCEKMREQKAKDPGVI